MVKNLSYHRKFQLLLVFAVFLSIIIYQLVISKTAALYTKNKELNTMLANGISASQQAEQFQRKLAYFDLLTQNSPVDSHEDNHDVLLETVSRFCKENDIILKSFPEQQVNKQEGIEMANNKFTVQGNFNKLLHLVYLLEQKKRTGKISSALFHLSKDTETRKPILLLTVYQQNIKKKL